MARRVVEARPSVRWHLSRAWTPVYRRSFGGFGMGTVIVRPHLLRGVERMLIGAGCAIHDGVWLQVEVGGGPLVIGDRAYLGHRVHVHCLDPIHIGDDVHIVDDVYIGSADHDRHDRTLAVGSGPVTIGDRVFLGQRAVVLGGVTIGDGATVGAGAVVTRDVAAGATVAGVPARVIGTAAVGAPADVEEVGR